MAPRKNDPSRRHGDDDAQDRSGGPGGPGGSLRVDKWLWCTRFFKTRSLAQEAVDGGHVQVDGDRIKASRVVKPGDRLVLAGIQRLRAGMQVEPEPVAEPSLPPAASGQR